MCTNNLFMADFSVGVTVGTRLAYLVNLKCPLTRFRKFNMRIFAEQSMYFIQFVIKKKGSHKCLALRQMIHSSLFRMFGAFFVAVFTVVTFLEDAAQLEPPMGNANLLPFYCFRKCSTGLYEFNIFEFIVKFTDDHHITSSNDDISKYGRNGRIGIFN